MPICSIPYAQTCQSTVHHMHMYANLQNSIHTSVLIYRIGYAQVYQSTVCHPHKYANLQYAIHTSMPIYRTPYTQVCQSTVDHMHKYASLTIERKQPLRAVWPRGTASPAMNAWGQQKSNSAALCVQCSYHERHIAMRRSYCSLSSSFCGKKMGASPGQNSRWFWLSSEKKTTKTSEPPKSKQSLRRIYNAQHTVQTPCFHQSRQGKNVAIH